MEDVMYYLAPKPKDAKYYLASEPKDVKYYLTWSPVLTERARRRRQGGPRLSDGVVIRWVEGEGGPLPAPASLTTLTAWPGGLFRS